MTKTKKKESSSPTDNSATQPENPKNRHRKKKKKKIFWKRVNQVEERANKESKAVIDLPPKTSQEISSNWKALQKLLQQKANELNSAVTAPDTYSKKKHSIKDGKTVPHVLGPNGIGKKLTSKGQIQSLCPASVMRYKKSTQVKNPQQVQEGGTEKRTLQMDNGEKKQRDIKRKRRKQEEPVETAPVDIWFDNVDPDDIEAALGPAAGKVARENLGIRNARTLQAPEPELVKEHGFEGLTKAVAIDCEMVGIGPTGEDSILARVSVVNVFGKCLYDKYVKPSENVTDYRTAVSGIRPEHLKSGEDFKTVQKEVADILRDRILVGHALHNDLKILLLDHPKRKIRDTQRYKPFKHQVKVKGDPFYAFKGTGSIQKQLMPYTLFFTHFLFASFTTVLLIESLQRFTQQLWWEQWQNGAKCTWPMSRLTTEIRGSVVVRRGLTKRREFKRSGSSL